MPNKPMLKSRDIRDYTHGFVERDCTVFRFSPQQGSVSDGFLALILWNGCCETAFGSTITQIEELVRWPFGVVYWNIQHLISWQFI